MVLYILCQQYLCAFTEYEETDLCVIEGFHGWSSFVVVDFPGCMTDRSLFQAAEIRDRGRLRRGTDRGRIVHSDQLSYMLDKKFAPPVGANEF